jgi:hypothetical protein
MSYAKQFYFYICIIVCAMFCSVTADAISWHQGSYNTDAWHQGRAPLGFDSDSVRTDIPAGRQVYYFRKLFYVPATRHPDTDITALRLTVLTEETVIVHFNGVQAGRTGRLNSYPSIDDDAFVYVSTTPHAQVFDLTDILFDCQNSLGQNWRPVTVELHRDNPGAPMVWDAFVSAETQGTWDIIVPEKSQWQWYPETGEPPVFDEQPVSGILYPLTGMPVLTAPGGTLPVIIAPEVNPDSAVFVLSGNRNTYLLRHPVSDEHTGRGRKLVFNVSSDCVPDTYTLSAFGFSENGAPDDQSVWSSAQSVGILPSLDTSLSVIHITDSHLPYRGLNYPDTVTPLQRIWDALLSLQPDLVVYTGDGYNEGNFRDQAALFHQFLQACHSPVAFVGGNHELGEWCGSGTSRQHYWDFFGWQHLDPRRDDHWGVHTRDFVVDAGPVSFVCVETWTSYTSFWNTWYPWRSLTYSQINWMRDVAEQRPDTHLVACYHYDFSGTLETEVMPMFGYNKGLSGHIHTATEYSLGPINYYTVGSTYQASRPLRWFHFQNGQPRGGNLLMPNPIEITCSPPRDVPATNRTITIKNHEFTNIPGFKTWVPMAPGNQYAVSSDDAVTLIGQWQGHGADWVCVEHDLEARSHVAVDIHPDNPNETHDQHIMFHVEHALFRSGQSNTISAALLNNGTGTLLDVYIALETDGVFFFRPGWSKSPAFQTLYIGAGQTLDLPVLEVTWPELPVYGETVTFWGIALDHETGELVTPIATYRLFY